MNKELKEFVEAILSCIDRQNISTEGKADYTHLFNQLIGVQIALATMGVNLHLDINPYYYKDGQASTYTLSFAE